ncbi:MAG: hypothetical protein R3Y13_02160 [bacterium]
MKYLLSIAWRTFDILDVDQITKLFSTTDMSEVGGIEVATSNYKDNEKMLKYCLENNMIFQCHTPKLKNESDIFSYLDDIHKLSLIYKNNINIVLHSLESDDIEESVLSTIKYVESILEYIKDNNLNIIISLENLNYHHDRVRINVNRIDEILNVFDNLKFTYDIGHDIYDNKNNSTLSDLQINKLNNVHLHNVYNDKDHELIFKNEQYLKYLKKSMKDINSLDFNKHIVLEVGVDMHPGKDVEEKLINYINSIKEIKTFFNI